MKPSISILISFIAICQLIHMTVSFCSIPKPNKHHCYQRIHRKDSVFVPYAVFRRTHLLATFPDEIEDWDSQHVESWLVQLGYAEYAPNFASDAGGIGVDGQRLVYLGTPDQLDHIEWQMYCLGVESEKDQLYLSNAIERLVSDGAKWTSEMATKNREIHSEFTHEKGNISMHGIEVNKTSDQNDYQI